MNILYLKEKSRPKKKWSTFEDSTWPTRLLLAYRVEDVKEEIGGAATHEKGFVEALRKKGYKVETVYYGKMTPFVIASKPDLIYQRQSRFSIAGVLLKLVHRVPFFLESNGSEVWMLKYWGGKKWLMPIVWLVEWLNWHFADEIFVGSESARQRIGRGIVNPNGVDVDRFRPEHRHSMRRFNVGWAGTYGPWHGIPTLVAASKFTGHDVEWVMIGDGKLRAYAEKNMPPTTCFFTVDHRKMPELLNTCNVLVAASMPNEDGSEFFGSPTKLFEYMAVGLPILTTPYGQPGTLLRDGFDCLFFTTAEELAQKIRLLMDNPELRKTLGQNARNTVLGYTWEINANVVLSAFRV